MRNHSTFSIKSLLPFLLTILFSLPTWAQKNSEIWEALLDNKREAALEMVNKLELSNDIENAFLKKLVEMENGIMRTDQNFIASLSGYSDYENYLFSHWMMSFMFDDYLENGFNADTEKAPHLIDASKIKNTTVRNGLYYLQSVTKRHTREWEDYKSTVRKITAIRDWEYCGVFENLNSSGIEMPYGPETDTSPKTTFDAQSKGDAKWYVPGTNEEAYKFFTNHSEYGSGVHYAQTFVNSPKDQRVHLKIGKGGYIRIWINDVPVLESETDYITELDAYTYAVNLQKGVNRILVKSATEGVIPYFIMRLEDTAGNPLNNYSVSFKDRKYKKGSLGSVNPELLKHSVEAFFENRLEDPNADAFLTKFSLFQAYYRNGHVEKALEILLPWSEQYPNSSFIKSCLLQCYNLLGDSTTASKLENNLKRQDPNYYLSLIYEFEDFDELMKLDIETYESKLTKIGESLDYPFMKTCVDLLISLRRTDREQMRLKLDELLADETIMSDLKSTFSEFYSSVFNDDDATINVLEKFNAAEYNWDVIQYLAYYYTKQNRIEEAIALYDECLEHFDDDNSVHYKIIALLHDIGEFERSDSYIDMALQNFPNSYLFTKLKGDVQVQLKKDAEAIKWYEKALRRSPSNYQLRSKINDLQNGKNPLHQFNLESPYEYIAKNRNTETKNNYGLIELLRQSDVLVYKNGGGEYNTTLIYEITSQNGVDIFKEYDLGLYGDYTIKKSEIVKPNGDTVPADRSGSSLVFDDLEIGDVVYVDYEARYTSSGRFYNEYMLNHSFTGYHPSLNNTYRLLTHDKKVNHVISNGALDYKSYAKKDLYVHEWSIKNHEGIPISEDYMPAYYDVISRLHIGSIESWNEIAVWYSDIVRNQLKFDETVEKAFESIFPEGYEQLSETERAKRIYYYITDNFNYSHVNFRQGGYVPQKPAKTIKTKLGDCKDFSSLFLVLAKQAELEAKLVLILTSDYGTKDLILPSTDFNHCIIKVDLEGEEQFLELTSKYLPFKSLPMSLRNATGLEIPYSMSNSTKSELFRLKNKKRDRASIESDYVLDLNRSGSNFEITYQISGHLASYYIKTFATQEGNLLEDTVFQEISNMASEQVQLEGIKNFDYQRESGSISFTSNLSSKIKINRVGDLSTFSIPYFLNPYNYSIIQLEDRKYPIDYKLYENSDSYRESMRIRINEGETFMDIPQNAEYQFKDHRFSITYEKVKPNELKVEVSANVSPNSISTAEYTEFRDYVTKVLDTRDNLVSFK